jgi:hypothetical protein
MADGFGYPDTRKKKWGFPLGKNLAMSGLTKNAC